jgi:hypothetical protein
MVSQIRFWMEKVPMVWLPLPQPNCVLVDALRTYGTLPVRFLLVAFGMAISVLLIAMRRSWREEWDSMDFSGYLLGGTNWNEAGC